ncbi:MAG: zf-HC2 domain-containing protein [Herminiimonas sp.]|nr:zf-HC2 domain-containing protein [Herminiimonas sp.]
MSDPGGIKPTCREVHRLVSEAMDRKLTMVERVRMRLHLVVCEACNRFNRQMDLIRSAMRRLSDGEDRRDGQ